MSETVPDVMTELSEHFDVYVVVTVLTVVGV